MCKVEKLSDISLLALCGKLAGQRLKFLLDSGASCNFIGLKKLVELDIDYDLVISQAVKLADGSALKTCGKVQLTISFGPYTYRGLFFILDAEIPTILGMQFFKDCQPNVNWREKEVYVSVGRQKLKLPSISNDQSCERISVKSRPGRERVQCVQHENQFALLSDENVQNTGATLSSCVEASNLVIAPDDSSLAVACTACTDKVSGCTALVQSDVSAV